MTPTLFRNVRLAGEDSQPADVLVRDGRIQTVGEIPHPDGDTRVIQGDGHLLMPGLINAHFHSPGSFNKGALEDMPLELFMLYEVPPFECPETSARLNYLRTMLGAAEMLKSGVTAVHDDPFYVPKVSMELIDSVMSAYADSGLRATVSINMPNIVEYDKYPFLRELLPEDMRHRMTEQPPLSTEFLLTLYREFFQRWHGVENGRIRCSTSCSAPQRVEIEYLRALSELAQEFDTPYNMHILETKLQRVLGEERFGESLVRYVARHGVLNEHALVIHAIWIDEFDMDLLASSGASIAHNPLCNLKLGSGVMPFRQLTDRGINICLGSDEMCSDDAVNMWNVMKFAGLVHKITEPDYRVWPRAQEILNCAIPNAAKSMRLENRIGAVREGMEADLILVDLSTLAFTPLNDLERQLVFCENGSSVRIVMVQGEIVCEQGRLTKINEEDLKSEIRQVMEGYRKQFQEVDHWAATLEPIYREMYLRAAARNVGMNRWVS